MTDALLLASVVAQAIAAVYLVRGRRDRCPLLAGAALPRQDDTVGRYTASMASVDFSEASLQILSPNAENIWKPREIALDVVCRCGCRTCFRMTDPLPEGADDTLRCGVCGRMWSQLGEVIRERSQEFRDYLRVLHERN